MRQISLDIDVCVPSPRYRPSSAATPTAADRLGALHSAVSAPVKKKLEGRPERDLP